MKLSEQKGTHGHMHRLKVHQKSQDCELIQQAKNSEGRSGHADKDQRQPAPPAAPSWLPFCLT